MKQNPHYTTAEISAVRQLLAADAPLATAVRVLPDRSEAALAEYAYRKFGSTDWQNEYDRKRSRANAARDKHNAAHPIDRTNYRCVATYVHATGECRHITFCHDRAEYDAAVAEAKTLRFGRLTDLFVESIAFGRGHHFIVERWAA